MRQRLFSCAAVFAVAVSSLPAWATEADALAFSSRIQATHVPFGTVLDPIFSGPASNQIIGYTRCGDSAIWTGHYLAAEAFRYQVTQSPDALNNVKQAIAGIKSLLDVTGTNLLARCLVPASSPFAAGIASEEAGNGIHTNHSAGYIWVGNTSRDQYLGVAFGLGVAYDMVNDAGVRSSIGQIAQRLIGFLTGHDWNIVMPDGTIATTFLIRPDQILTLLQVGRHVNSSAFSTDYDVQRILLSITVLAPITVDSTDDGSYFKFNLDYIDFYNLIRLESSDAKSIYQSAYRVLRGNTGGQQNAIFNLVDRGLNGPDAARDAQTVALLNQWLQRPLRDVTVNLQNVVPVCGNQACAPIPVALRPPDEYLWQESPFQLAGGGSGIIETAGVDYILPYWMARYYGVIGPVAAQSAAAPNGAVAPDSIASLYGSDFAPAPQQAGSVALPASLGGVSVTIADSAGVARQANLMYVSPSQINFVVPAGTAPGLAKIDLNGSFQSTVNVQAVAPTLFSMSGDGKGVAAANAIAVPAANPQAQSALPVFQCFASGCSSTPIPLNSNNTVFLILYGTGIRGESSLAKVSANIGGVSVPVSYAGPQGTYDGLDQVNVALPASLRGSGEVNVILTVDGQVSNVVTINVQ